MAPEFRHVVTIGAGGDLIVGPTTILGVTKSYEFQCSMTEPADSFTFYLPWSRANWNACRTDARITISVDGAPQITGLVDTREKDSNERTIMVSGRDLAGRLVQEAIPSTNGLDGLDLVSTVKALAYPWFVNVATSNAQNRSVRRGRGHRASANGEPAILLSRTRGRGYEKGQVIDPGCLRWKMIEELCASVGLCVWSSVDGRTLIVGQPNYNQDPQYEFIDSRARSTVTSMRRTESVADRFALMEVYGAARGSSVNFGADVVNRSGVVTDGPGLYGVGKGFLFPKRAVLPQNAVQSNDEATRVAVLEMARRDFGGHKLAIACKGHGQARASGVPTLFAPDTIATVIDEDLGGPELWLIHTVGMKANADTGEVTDLQLVPHGTRFVA